jgi:transposase
MQLEANRGLVAERDELRQRNEELCRRLGLNSTNSSKPPSSDGLKRKRRTARSPERERRKRLGRKPGKQKGAPGQHLAMTSRPTRIVELLPAVCEKCSGSLVEHAGEEGMERRQVMDLPPPSGLEATEYRATRPRCAECGHVTKPGFPEWAKAPVQYGPRMHATANYLAVHQYLPFERMAEYVRDTYGVKISAGTLVAMVRRGGQRVQPAVEEIKRQLQKAGTPEGEASAPTAGRAYADPVTGSHRHAQRQRCPAELDAAYSRTPENGCSLERRGESCWRGRRFRVVDMSSTKVRIASLRTLPGLRRGDVQPARSAPDSRPVADGSPPDRHAAAGAGTRRWPAGQRARCACGPGCSDGAARPLRAARAAGRARSAIRRRRLPDLGG